MKQFYVELVCDTPISDLESNPSYVKEWFEIFDKKFNVKIQHPEYVNTLLLGNPYKYILMGLITDSEHTHLQFRKYSYHVAHFSWYVQNVSVTIFLRVDKDSDNYIAPYILDSWDTSYKYRRLIS